MDFKYRLPNQDKTVAVRTVAEQQGQQIDVDGRSYLTSDIRWSGSWLHFTIAGRQHRAAIVKNGDTLFVAINGKITKLEKIGQRRPRPSSEETGQAALVANMPGTIMTILVSEGDQVEKGQPLLLIEAMKMEQRLAAPRAGHVETIHVQPGQLVQQGELLVTLSS